MGKIDFKSGITDGTLTLITDLYIIVICIGPCKVGIVEGGHSARKCAKHCIRQQRGDLPLSESHRVVVSPLQEGNGLRHARRQIEAHLDRVWQYSRE